MYFSNFLAFSEMCCFVLLAFGVVLIFFSTATCTGEYHSFV